MKKIKLLLGLIVLMLFTFCVGCTGCKGTEDSGDSSTDSSISPSITLSETALDLDVYESAELTATLHHVEGDIIWASSDQSVATVSNGKVTAIKEGTATVTATVGEVSASCSITVYNSYSAPILVVDKTEISVGKDSEITISAHVLWKGTESSEKIEYMWSIASGVATDIVSLTVDETDSCRAIVKGLAYGESEIVVSAEAYGRTLTTHIPVKCCNADLRFVSTQAMENGKYAVNLALMNVGEHISNLTPVVEVYNKDVLISDATLIWEADDASIASVDQNGAITAVSAGETIVRGGYEGNEICFAVCVYSPELTFTLDSLGDIDLSETEKAIELSFDGADVEGTLTSVKLNEIELTEFSKSIYADNCVTLDKADIPANVWGNTEITAVVEYWQEEALYCRTYVRSSAMILTMLIENTEDFNSIEVYAKAAALADGQQVDSPRGARGGYFALGNDFTFTGDTFLSTIGYDCSENPKGVHSCYGDSDRQKGFYGTLDGRGYNIDGLKINDYRNGLFLSVAAGGVIKDISFTNASMGETASLFFAPAFHGTMENVYVQANGQASTFIGNQGDLARGIYGGAKLKNVFIDIDPSYGVAETPVFVEIAKASIENVVVVGNTYGTSTGYDAYENMAEILTDGVLFGVWDTSFWTMANGYPYPKNLPLPEVTVVAPQYVDVNGEYPIETERTSVLSLDQNALDMGITIVDNTLIVPDNADILGGAVTVTATSMYDPSITASATVYIVTQQEITLAALAEIEQLDPEPLTVDLLDNTITGDLTAISFNGTAIELSDVTYLDNIVTVPKTAIAELWGEQAIELVFELKDNGNVIATTTVKTSVLLITQTITNASELLGMAAQAQELSGGGYFVLGDNITDMSTGGDYNFANKNSVGTSTIPFAGTFDGRGYYIDGLRVQIYNSGVFGVCNGATIKNVAFINGADGTATDAKYLCSGTVKLLENVYIQMTTQNARVITASVETFRNIFIDVPEGSTSLVITDGTHDKSTVYVVGNTNGSSPKKYANRAALIAAAVDFNGWVGDFWALDSDGLPIAKIVKSLTSSLVSDKNEDPWVTDRYLS